MRVSFTTEAGDFFSLDIDASMELENLKALAEIDTSIPMANQQIFHNGSVLSGDKKTLSELGIKQDDILLIRKAAGFSTSTSSASAPVSNSSDSQIEQMRLALLSNPGALAQVSAAQPEVARAAREDPARFKQLMAPIVQERMQEAQRMQHLSSLHSADPFDADAQKKIEEMIRLQNIQENLEAAMENNPEAFASVVMLYIDCLVNGKHVKAFVDSGAQTTIMSPECAEYCGIMHLCDSRFAGIARGVGTAKILGRIHAVTLKLGQDNDAKKNMFLQCSITVMEGKGVDMLLGLDMLKRFQACIDLSNNVLRIGDFEAPFLSEKDLPDTGKKQPELPVSPTLSSKEEKEKEVVISSGTSSSNTTTQAGTKYPEDHIKMLISLGATREQAINALDAASGNIDVAAGLIFG